MKPLSILMSLLLLLPLLPDKPAGAQEGNTFKQEELDQSVRVEFNTSGATAKDPELINRITQSYNRRMGR